MELTPRKSTRRSQNISVRGSAQERPKSAYKKSFAGVSGEKRSAMKPSMMMSRTRAGFDRKYEKSGSQFVDGLTRQVDKLLDRSARKKRFKSGFNINAY